LCAIARLFLCVDALRAILTACLHGTVAVLGQKTPCALAAPLPHILYFPRADIAGRDVQGMEQRCARKNLHREEIKSGQTLGAGAMNIKSKTYMRNAEFKARQLWLGFTDAVGIALQIMADVKESTAD